MKTSKKLKAITLILVIILITILSFLGVYDITKVYGNNLIKDYKVGMELNDRRLIRLKVDDTVNTVYYDSEGNKVDKKEETGEYTEKQEPVNNPENLNKENYSKAKKIIEDRLRYIKVKPQEYNIRFNKETGAIELEMLNNESTDDILRTIGIQGDFKIVDADTKELLMDKSFVKEAKVEYVSNNSGLAAVRLDIEFNKEGSKKLEELKDVYIKTTQQVVNAEGKTESKDVEKNILVKIDDNQILSTNFSESYTEGHIYCYIGQATQDTELLSEYERQSSIYATVINTDTVPVVYTVEQNTSVVSNMNMNTIPTVAIISLAIEIVVLVVMFKARGIIASILQIGYTALLLLVLKYTNVYITLGGLFAVVLVSIVNGVFIGKVLFDAKKNGIVVKVINENLIKFINISIPVLIVAIVFCFAKWLEINSFGMVVFYGYAISLLYNVVFTKGILKNMLDK